MYQPLQHDAKACQSQVKRVATVVFYCGDEVLRQWYKRYTWLELVFWVGSVLSIDVKVRVVNCRNSIN